MPLISVIIPAYNAERWIGVAIASALGQTWCELEVVVVDLEMVVHYLHIQFHQHYQVI